jgi:hypothetical protein
LYSRHFSGGLFPARYDASAGTVAGREEPGLRAGIIEGIIPSMDSFANAL